jgi:iron complex transport system ATP-binding protein
MLVAENLSTGYSGRAVVRAVSLQLAPGEMVVLLGPNGSGKTTLVRALARVLPLFEGRVLLDNQPAANMEPRTYARHVAYAPQETPLDMGFTIDEMVMMGRYPHRQSLFADSAADHAAVQRALQMTRLELFAHRSYKQLSGGEKQRVNLARALAQNARYLLLDEPTAHLDLHHQVQLLAQLRHWIQNEGLGVLCVLHDLNLAAEYADRVILMNDGQTVAQGEPAEVLQSEMLESVYRTPVLVRLNPLSGRPLVFALSPDQRLPMDNQRRHRLHVIAGGGSGTPLFYPLLEMGWRVSTGVNNLMDTDEEVARALGLEQVTEAPFSPISDSAFRRAQGLVLGARAVVVADMPFGHGNLANLQLALEAQKAGIPIYALAPIPISERDFAGGEATELWEKLIANRMEIAIHQADLLQALQPWLTDFGT